MDELTLAIPTNVMTIQKVVTRRLCASTQRVIEVNIVLSAP
ncbi:MAG TPA: hypothetical protein VIM18_07615 [Solirubrobacteraceae bacterium]